MVGLLLVVLLGGPGKKEEPERDRPTRNARKVVAAVVRAARENAGRKMPLAKDALTAYYVRAAAREARQLPEKEGAQAFLLGLGVALDTSRLLRTVPLLNQTWDAIESEDERDARVKVVGEPAAHGRHDLVQHFAVSAALTVLVGESLAESAGVAKELRDAQEGGSGFSFADLAADLAGIAFARRVLARPAGLAEVAAGFRVEDHVLKPAGLPEELSRKKFEEAYGGVRDARFRKARDDLVRRLEALPGFPAKK